MGSVSLDAGDVRASIAESLKVVYEPQVNKNLKDMIFLYNEISADSEGLTSGAAQEGLYVEGKRKVAVNSTAGGRSEFGEWPRPGRSRWNVYKTNVTPQHAVGGFSGLAAAIARNDIQGVVKITEESVQEVTDSAARSLARQTQLSSDGAVATIASVDDGDGSAGDPWILNLGTNPRAQLARFLLEGAPIQFGNVSGGVATVEAGTAIVTKEAYFSDESTGEVTVECKILEGSPDPDATNEIFIEGTGNQQLQGLDQIISDTTSEFESIDPADDPTWVATRQDADSDTLSVDLLAQFVSRMDRLGPDAEKNVIVSTSKGLQRQVTAQLFEQVAYPSALGLTADPQQAYMIPGVGKLKSYHEAQKGTVRVLDKSHLKYSQAGPWSFEKQGDSNLLLTGRQSQREIVLTRYLQLVTDARNAHGELYNLDDPDLY